MVGTGTPVRRASTDTENRRGRALSRSADPSSENLSGTPVAGMLRNSVSVTAPSPARQTFVGFRILTWTGASVTNVRSFEPQRPACPLSAPVSACRRTGDAGARRHPIHLGALTEL